MTKFTVIVPTRERCDTLRSTLRTCVAQDYENLEILVSDNASVDATESVVRSFNDPRIRYVKTPGRLSMASNWEFALSHVDDGFVLVVGDDDGLLPNAIADIARILDSTRCRAASWTQASYTWPTCKGGKTPNRLKIPLERKCTVHEAKAALAQVMTYRKSFKELPGLYWGAVHRDVLRSATPASKRFFNGVNPDLYSCIASTVSVDRFVHATGPFTLRGTSYHSTGVSFTSGDTAKDSKVATFFKEADLPIHPDVAMVPSSNVYLTEAYAQVRDHVPGANALPPPDYAVMFTVAMKEMAEARSQAAYEMVRDAVLQMGTRHHLDEAARSAVAEHPFLAGEHRESPPGVNILRRTITIDTSQFDIVDVERAAQLCFDTLRLYELDYLSPRGLATSLGRRVVDRIERRFGGSRS
jgi:glycosyltransferase involved in cell wall biosynthesis